MSKLNVTFQLCIAVLLLVEKSIVVAFCYFCVSEFVGVSEVSVSDV